MPNIFRNVAVSRTNIRLTNPWTEDGKKCPCRIQFPIQTGNCSIHFWIFWHVPGPWNAAKQQRVHVCSHRSFGLQTLDLAHRWQIDHVLLGSGDRAIKLPWLRMYIGWFIEPMKQVIWGPWDVEFCATGVWIRFRSWTVFPILDLILLCFCFRKMLGTPCYVYIQKQPSCIKCLSNFLTLSNRLAAFRSEEHTMTGSPRVGPWVGLSVLHGRW